MNTPLKLTNRGDAAGKPVHSACMNTIWKILRNEGSKKLQKDCRIMKDLFLSQLYIYSTLMEFVYVLGI